MRLGIGSWSYPWAIGVQGYPQPESPLSALGLLEKARAAGVGLVQIADNLPLDRLEAPELDRLRTGADALGVALEAGTRGVRPEHLARYLGIARFLGARLLRTLADTADLAQAEAWIREALPEFAAAGVTIALENYERHTARDLARLVERLDSPWVGVCLDTVNSLGALETPRQVLEALAAHAVNLHVKDFDVVRVESGMGFAVVSRPAGEGRLEIPALLERIGRYGREPSVILELWPPFTETAQRTILLEEEWVKRSVQYLKPLLSAAGGAGA